MRFDRTVVLPAAPHAVWSQIIDLGALADCLPGASLASVDDGTARGSLAVKVGRVRASFDGEARILVQDDRDLRLEVEAEGSGSQGQAHALIAAGVVPEGSGSRLDLSITVEITGALARLGGGMATPVVERLIDRFAATLADRLGGAQETAQRELASQGAGRPSPAATSSEDANAIDLPAMILASTPVRVGVAVVGALLGLLVVRRLGARSVAPTIVLHVHVPSGGAYLDGSELPG